MRANLETPPAAVPAAATSASAPSSAPSSTTSQVAPADATVAAPGVKQSQNLAIEAAQPVRLLPLIGRALWDWFAGLVRWLVGRRPNVSR